MVVHIQCSKLFKGMECRPYSAIHGIGPTVHYKEPLKSFEIRVGHSPDFGLHSVAILPQCAESDVKQYPTYIPPPPPANSVID